VSTTICRVFSSSDITDVEYIGSNLDPIILLSGYESNTINLRTEKLPEDNTLLCYNNHLLLYWIIRQKIIQYPDLKIIVVDAHQEMLDKELNSCSFLRWLIKEEILSRENLLLIGIRVFEENFFLIENQIHQITTNQWIENPSYVQQYLCDWVGNHPVYVSVDIDVVDSKFVPGCVDPEPLGVTPDEVETLIWNFLSLNVIGLDLAEIDLSKDDNKKSTYFVAERLLNAMYGVLTSK
jgi:agmatinase